MCVFWCCRKQRKQKGVFTEDDFGSEVEDLDAAHHGSLSHVSVRIMKTLLQWHENVVSEVRQSATEVKKRIQEQKDGKKREKKKEKGKSPTESKSSISTPTPSPWDSHLCSLSGAC